MPADPVRIASITVDGVVLTKVDPAIKTLHIGAIEGSEIEMFFDLEADAQIMLDERWAWESNPDRLREGIEVETSLGLGTEIELAPAVPIFSVLDETRSIDELGAVRAYAADYTTGRYSVELIGIAEAGDPTAPLAISGTPGTDAPVGVPYSFTPGAAGGTPPYTFGIAGVIPDGLVFDSVTGTLSGTPTGLTPPALDISGSPGLAAVVGTPYSFTPSATGGSLPYTFSLAGALPPGLSFNPATGAITGTPT